MTTAQTTLAAGTDAQAFCYDEQSRLVWATSQTATNGGPTGCGASNTAGTLTSQGAQYTASYSYDALNRLTSSPLGTYTYGDPAHLHAATAVGSSYTASYDAVGEMTCRAPNSGATCAAPNGSKTGAGLGYTNEGQLTAWRNTLAGTPTTTEAAAYDGEGHRVASTTSSNGAVISTTDYLAGGLEEVTTAGSTTTLTKYESVPGVCNVVIVGSGPSESISYVATDGLGSVSEALDSNGNVTAQQLYGPYGAGRFALGSMPTSKGYTGQYADATTELDYYGARYYDPLVGQFTSADTANDGLNRYAYVGGNPETATDPTGHRCSADGVCPGAGGGGGSGGCGQCGKSPCAPNCSPPNQPPAPAGPSGGKGSGVCNPDSPTASGACTKLAYNVTKPNGIRDNALKPLQTGAYIKLIVGYLLILASDVVDLVSGSVLSRLEALLDLATTVFNSILPLMGQVVQNLLPQFHDAYENVLHFVSHLNGVMGLIQTAIGFVKQGNWLMQASVNVALQIATDAEAPVPSILWTLARSFFGPALTNYLDAGAHDLIRSGYDDLAEWQREQNMAPIQWCEQYGHGVCGTIPTS